MNDFIIDEYAVKAVWKNCGQYWLSTKNGKLINCDEITDFDIPTNITQSQFLINLGYIPYVRVSENEVIRAFTSTLKNKKLVDALSKIDDSSISDTFWKYYKAYSEISGEYAQFEKNYVLQKVIDWCNENGIKYVLN